MMYRCTNVGLKAAAQAAKDLQKGTKDLQKAGSIMLTAPDYEACARSGAISLCAEH